MARIRFRAVPTAAIALVASVAKTVLQIVAPTNQRVAVKGWSVSFDGIVAGRVPVTVQVMRQTTAGTMSTTTQCVKEDPNGSETIQTLMRYNATVEPTYSEILDTQFIHPQTGVEYPFAFDEELILNGGSRLAIVCNAPDNVNVLPKFRGEE